jgi:DNA replication protein DnaC
MSELITGRIQDHATRLGLPRLAENLALLVERAETDNMGYREFIDTVLGEELGLREGRRFRTALKLSGLPHHKTLDKFDFAFQPDLDVRKIRNTVTEYGPESLHPGDVLICSDPFRVGDHPNDVLFIRPIFLRV